MFQLDNESNKNLESKDDLDPFFGWHTADQKPNAYRLLDFASGMVSCREHVGLRPDEMLPKAHVVAGRQPKLVYWPYKSPGSPISKWPPCNAPDAGTPG